jgi:hypothetical protein
VRLYSAPQSHWTIVAILGICAFGEPVQAGSFAAIKSDPLPGLACSTSLARQAAGSVWDAYWSVDEADLCRWHDMIAALFWSGDSGIANQQCEGLPKRKLRYPFSAQSRRNFPASSGVARSTDGRHSGVPGLPHALQFLDSNLPPDSIHFGLGGAFGYLYWGISHGNRTSAT